MTPSDPNRSIHMFIFHNVRDAPAVASQPTVHPVSWRIVRTSAGFCHLVAVMQSGSVRMTSALQTADGPSHTVVTSSGRVYELDEGPAQNLQVVSMLIARARLELSDDCEDVSAQVWGQMMQSTQ